MISFIFSDGPTPHIPPGPNVGGIVGGVFGGLSLIILIILIVILIRNYGTPDVRAGIQKIKNTETVQGWMKVKYKGFIEKKVCIQV